MRLRRSPRELQHRLLQEIRNVWLWSLPPRPARVTPPSPLPWLPDRETAAARIRSLRFPLLESLGEIGPDFRWRRDAIHGVETEPRYFRLIPYLDPERAGDHKLIWEPNRHQHLVVLACDGKVTDVVDQIQSWIEQNPFQCGINWASALEVGFRALSWLWIYHFIGDRFAPEFRDEFLRQLYLHGRHLNNNLSYYFSPNTHLLGEAVALHALGLIYSNDWRDLSTQVVRQQMEKQVRSDGGHFEQSTYYHRYALDMFAFHASLEPQSDEYMAKLHRMEEFLAAVMGPMPRLPLIGDDDGGIFIDPFARESAAAVQSTLFRDTGLAVMTAGNAHIVIDAGPFGPWSSGHSHSDTLSLVARLGDEDVLVDPGTFTYMGTERNAFRGSAAHNTIRIDGRDQAIVAGPFGWRDQPQVRIVAWRTTANEDFLQAECSYAGFTHRRSVRFSKPDRVQIDDEVSGPPGEHLLEQFWHLGSKESAKRFTFDGPAELLPGWVSSSFNEKHPAPVLEISRKATLPHRFTTGISLAKI